MALKIVLWGLAVGLGLLWLSRRAANRRARTGR
jgi:hypothetical protein